MRQRATEILRIKQAVRDRDGRCVECGISCQDYFARTGRSLDVHRIEPGSLYHEDACVTICRSCHGSQPRRRDCAPDLAREVLPLHVYLSKDLYAAFMQAVSISRRSLRAEVEIALEEHLKRIGLWPPAGSN